VRSLGHGELLETRLVTSNTGAISGSPSKLRGQLETVGPQSPTLHSHHRDAPVVAARIVATTKIASGKAHPSKHEQSKASKTGDCS